ncbi:glycoside hydrolase family 35 protein [Phanerochaete carnosa HHB-10118-sp]|uniref:beta-galactosidase n=1 Tax=Phanerochaete carnosa (strain HHB-10118-sp) TaxID=650164 RepID=K5W3E9_PHACS|nr:glycoside hydrolase family 35 protein [Phanerochaete carnosa HHB-10118-sp]EKM53444.1 glycoside hydrolase family 35 protein [Phanerochaete carnosa HHB-10118-sp]
MTTLAGPSWPVLQDAWATLQELCAMTYVRDNFLSVILLLRLCRRLSRLCGTCKRQACRLPGIGNGCSPPYRLPTANYASLKAFIELQAITYIYFCDILPIICHITSLFPALCLVCEPLGRLAAYALSAQVAISAVPSYEVPPGSPGYYHGNSSAAVTFDAHSLFLDDKRLYVFSGEVHTWRMPSGPAIWRDVFQKMRAAGFNAISVYHHWGLSEGKQGSLDFNYYRSHTDLYEVAKEVGLLVIARPGPYINAETTGGGFPGWLTNNPAKARTNETGFSEAWTSYMDAASEFIKPYQYPDGPVIAVQAENEFFESSSGDPGRSESMVQIEDNLRGNGITKVPITHNDASPSGRYAHGLGEVDLYMWDSYPQGFDCANPTLWREINSGDLDTAHKAINPDIFWATGEFQAGAFDPWGGSGYDKCFQLTNEQFANMVYKNNYGAQTTYQNLYMVYGGTNWGNLAEPTVYTSYDYGAPIREDRTLSPKYSEIKLQAAFLHASPDFLVATRFGNGTIGFGTAFSDNPRIYTTALSSPSGAHFYIVRSNSVTHTNMTKFTLRVNTTEGPLTIPQFGPQATLDARESQILVSEYSFNSHTLKYSTAEVFAWATIDSTDHLILYANEGHQVEAVISGVPSDKPKVTGSSSISARTGPIGTFIITGSPKGVSSISLGNTMVFVADKHTALSFWNVHLSSANTTVYDRAPDVPSIFVFGPYLVRNATLLDGRSVLALHGDINATTTLDVVAPSSVKRVIWNGRTVHVQKSNIGTLRGILKFTAQAPELPDLRTAEWLCTDSLPEIQSNFNDSSWVTANKTSTGRPYQPFAGKYMLYADEYGFHQGNTITRGHFTGRSAIGVQLSVQGGYNFGYSAWINSKFLGSNQGTNQYSAGGGVDLTNDTWLFDPADLNDGDNVLTAVLDPTGLEEDYNGDDTFKTPRGIRGYSLLGSGDFDFWKIQGNLGGEDFPDKVRGPLNEGGLFVEREGAHLPGFPATNWKQSRSCTPYIGISGAGIQAYRTTFSLDLPYEIDTPIALKITRTPTSSYRSIIHINGWQFGRFNSKDGPQELFVLPEGILKHNGKNELLVTLWSLDAEGAKMADLELISTAVVSTSKESTIGLVQSPSYRDLR